MAHEVIMPMLGMAQDTGKLLSWLKKSGDAVAVGDVLFEVETDKSVSEVEAEAAGFLTDVAAAEGTDVPVGQRIAMISDTAQDGAPPPVARPEPKTEQPAPSVPARPPTLRPPPQPEGRILASPKARQLARERGLDLARLVDAGVTQPFHVADLEQLAGMRAAVIPGGRSLLMATCNSAAFEALLVQMKEDAGIVLEPHALVAGFAAAALRTTLAEGDTRIVVALSKGFRGATVLYADPDRTRPTRPRLAEPGAEPTLVLRDMTDTRLTGMSLVCERAPALTLGGGGGRDFAVSFSFSDMAEDAAADLLEGFLARLEAPLEHLV